MEHRPVKPMELAKKVMGNDYNATEEVETIMKDLGIEESGLDKLIKEGVLKYD